jgi:hypothetical protein
LHKIPVSSWAASFRREEQLFVGWKFRVRPLPLSSPILGRILMHAGSAGRGANDLRRHAWEGMKSASRSGRSFRSFDVLLLLIVCIFVGLVTWVAVTAPNAQTPPPRGDRGERG